MPIKKSLYSISEKFNNLFKLGSCNFLIKSNLISWCFLANLFHGHTAKQSSQPKILFPMLLLNFFSILLLCSIVKYEIHFLGSRIKDLTIAPVGHASLHFSHVPQNIFFCFFFLPQY